MHTNDFLQKNAKFYECKLCHYISCNKTNFNIHLETKKHKMQEILINTNKALINTNKNDKDFVQVLQKVQDGYLCDLCGKTYKHKPSLYNHKKKCIQQEDQEDDLVIYNSQTQNIDYKEMFYKMLEKSENFNSLFIGQLQNKIEEQNKIINEKDKTITELIPKIGGGVNNNISANTNTNTNSHNNIHANTNTNTNTNSNNTVNNINLFLNENCKDALSIDEFVKKIEIKLTDLFVTKRKGLVNGISNIFIRSLSDLPAKKRPLWCSDKKRKKIFIKEDAWSEDVNNIKTKRAIKDVSFMQAKNVTKYTEKNPDWKEREDKKDEYMDIVKNTTTSIVDKEGDVINKMVDAIYLDDEGSKKMIE